MILIHTWRNKPVELEICFQSGVSTSNPEASKSFDKPKPTSPAA